MVEGTKVVTEALAGSLIEIEEIYGTPEWLAAHANLLRTSGGEVVSVTLRELTKVSALKTPQGVLAVAAMPVVPLDLSQPQHQLCLYLDGVRDPGNLGTILRVADWFGFRHVYLSEDCVDIYHPKVIQASMGSVFRVTPMVGALSTLVAGGKIPVWCTALEGEPLWGLTPPTHGLLVLGNESHGIPSKDLGHCTQQVSIPSDFSLGAESLNVAVAAAICCAHFRAAGI
ncbi:MAG: RNA methyltransferase [Saprospiraceae bacterium]|nr:RNA methyltransferase [Saprospiraceae bacterium]